MNTQSTAEPADLALYRISIARLRVLASNSCAAYNTTPYVTDSLAAILFA